VSAVRVVKIAVVPFVVIGVVVLRAKASREDLSAAAGLGALQVVTIGQCPDCVSQRVGPPN
jgi:hypothetical protein